MQGYVSVNKEGEARLNVQELHHLEPYIPSLVKETTWYLADDPGRMEFLRNMRDTIDATTGDTKVRFALRNRGEIYLVAQTAGSLTLYFSHQTMSKLGCHPSLEGIEYRLADIPHYERRF